jgi:hypothetical protein
MTIFLFNNVTMIKKTSLGFMMLSCAVIVYFFVQRHRAVIGGKHDIVNNLSCVWLIHADFWKDQFSGKEKRTINYRSFEICSVQQ